MGIIGWLTCERFPAGFVREEEVVSQLRAWGHEVEPWVWTQSAPKAFDLVVVRSPWDYHLRVDEWWAWLDELPFRCANPTAVLRWNSDKRYLLELQARGVKIVPTVLATRGLSLAEVMGGWDDVVVKPVVSASSHRTWRTRGDEEERFASELAVSDLLVQPFLSEVIHGEWSLVFIQRAYSHAVVKRPQSGDFRSQEEHGGVNVSADPPPYVLEAARQCLALVEGDILYARVDGVVRNGTFYLMELELVDPVLFLEHCPGATQRFARATQACFEKNRF